MEELNKYKHRNAPFVVKYQISAGYCRQRRTETTGFTYRNFPHHLLLAAAGISAGPITVSSNTLAVPETAHNLETGPQQAVCRTAPRPSLLPKRVPFQCDLQQARSSKQLSIEAKQELAE